MQTFVGAVLVVSINLKFVKVTRIFTFPIMMGGGGGGGGGGRGAGILALSSFQDDNF